ncbi:uncharacterized protein ACO6RY_13392 [Pungitius sinensis]
MAQVRDALNPPSPSKEHMMVPIREPGLSLYKRSKNGTRTDGPLEEDTSVTREELQQVSELDPRTFVSGRAGWTCVSRPTKCWFSGPYPIGVGRPEKSRCKPRKR